MSLAVRLVPETLRSAAFGAIGVGYSAVGPALSHAVSIILFQNQTNADVLISLDGVDDHFFIPAGGFILFDLTTNKSTPVGTFISQGTFVFVKQSGGAPGSGAFYVSTLYGLNGNG